MQVDVVRVEVVVSTETAVLYLQRGRIVLKALTLVVLLARSHVEILIRVSLHAFVQVRGKVNMLRSNVVIEIQEYAHT